MKNILTIVLIFIASIVSAQSIDELKNQLKNAERSQEKMILNYQIAQAYVKKGDGDSAVDYARRAYQMANDKKNHSMATTSANILAKAYLRERDYRNADVWLKSAIKAAKLANDPDLLIQSVNERSKLAVKKRDYRRAYEIHEDVFDYFSKRGGRSISDMDSQYEILKSQLSKEQKKLEREKKTLEQDKASLEQEIIDLSDERDQLTKDKTSLVKKQKKLTAEKAKVEKEIDEKAEELETIAEEKEKAERRAKRKERQVKELNREALEKKVLYDEQQLELAQAELEVQKSRNIQMMMLAAGAFLVMMSLLFFLLYRSIRKRKKGLELMNRQIREEQERSKELLLNILPAPIAEELQTTGKAKTQQYTNATIFFSDFYNFSQISERLGPEKLVKELDYLFREFDQIVSDYGIEKIKTIGDAYMCASGLTTKRTLPNDMIRAAMEMQAFLEKEKQRKMKLGLPYFEARIGIHTGTVVAGVVGLKKFVYDIWGDAVNIAARMEQNCEVGKVNISQTTYEQVRYKFDCEYRGKVQAKNKGLIDMYYVKQPVAVKS